MPATRARDLSRADHRARHPDVPVPALQHPVGVDEGDAADRRLSFRLEIFLRLQPLLVPVLATAVRRPHLVGHAGSRRYRGVPPAEGRLRRTTSSASSVCRATASR